MLFLFFFFFFLGRGNSRRGKAGEASHGSGIWELGQGSHWGDHAPGGSQGPAAGGLGCARGGGPGQCRVWGGLRWANAGQPHQGLGCPGIGLLCGPLCPSVAVSPLIPPHPSSGTHWAEIWQLLWLNGSGVGLQPATVFTAVWAEHGCSRTQAQLRRLTAYMAITAPSPPKPSPSCSSFCVTCLLPRLPFQPFQLIWIWVFEAATCHPNVLVKVFSWWPSWVTCWKWQFVWLVQQGLPETPASKSLTKIRMLNFFNKRIPSASPPLPILGISSHLEILLISTEFMHSQNE